jgi:hypothetical protein
MSGNDWQSVNLWISLADSFFFIPSLYRGSVSNNGITLTDCVGSVPSIENCIGVILGYNHANLDKNMA